LCPLVSFPVNRSAIDRIKCNEGARVYTHVFGI
jgi:hypothetical protein